VKKKLIVVIIIILLLLVGGIAFAAMETLWKSQLHTVLGMAKPATETAAERTAKLLAKVATGDPEAISEYAQTLANRHRQHSRDPANGHAEQWLRKHVSPTLPRVQAALAYLLSERCFKPGKRADCIEAIALLEPLARKNCKMGKTHLSLELAQAYRYVDADQSDLWFGIAIQHCRENDEPALAALLEIPRGIDINLPDFRTGQIRSNMFRFWLSKTGVYDAMLSKKKAAFEIHKSDHSAIFFFEQAQVSRNSAAGLVYDEAAVSRLKIWQQLVIESRITPIF
jgi:hypothetical protein